MSGERVAFCTKCGTSNPDTAVFCTRCGSQLEPSQNITQPQSLPVTSNVNNYYYTRLRRRDRRRLARVGQGAVPSGLAEKEVIKEIVLIPCAYCGSLFPQTSTTCPNCGAKRKA